MRAERDDLSCEDVRTRCCAHIQARRRDVTARARECGPVACSGDDADARTQSREHWESVVVRAGFDLILVDDISASPGDKYRVYWNSGMLLSTDSYRGDSSVNSATCYFNYRGPRDAMLGCSTGWIGGTEPPVWYGSRDARDGLLGALGHMAESGNILEQWLGVPFRWLVHYREALEHLDAPSESRVLYWSALTLMRIARFPLEVRKCIGSFQPVK